VSPKRSLSIRSQLAFLVLASAAPAVFLGALLLVIDQRNDRQRLEEGSIATARAMVHAIDRELASITAAAEVLAASDRAIAGDVGKLREEAMHVIGRKIGAAIVLSGPDGRQLMNTLRPLGQPLPMHGNPAQLREVFATGRPVVSGLYRGGVLGRPVMSVDVPVLRDGKVVYDLSVGELPGRFLAILKEQHLPEGWIGAVFDRDGIIVARTQEHERFVGRPGAEYLVARIRQAAEGAPEGKTLEGIPVISPYSRSPDSGWTVALGIPESALAAQLTERRTAVVVAAAIVLALGLALAWGIGGHIANAIRALERPASQIGRGDEIDVPPLGLLEADELGQALVRAGQMIALAQHRAQHDPLTGLANRALFRELAAHSVETAKRAAAPVSVLFIDLDGFKKVNDEHGHDAGDTLLVAVAQRLKEAARGSDVVARVGGDEFAMLLQDADADTAATLAFRLAEILSAPYPVAGREIRVMASIGSATYPQSGATAQALLKSADEEMYRVKAARRGA
jgi:diguanylate cyclase (GGDEF)-like protein